MASLMQLRLPEAEMSVVRRLLTADLEWYRRRADQLPELLARARQRILDLEAERRDITRILQVLEGDEASGRPGLVHRLNEQLNLFHPSDPIRLIRAARACRTASGPRNTWNGVGRPQVSTTANA